MNVCASLWTSHGLIGRQFSLSPHKLLFMRYFCRQGAKCQDWCISICAFVGHGIQFHELIITFHGWNVTLCLSKFHLHSRFQVALCYDGLVWHSGSNFNCWSLSRITPYHPSSACWRYQMRDLMRERKHEHAVALSDVAMIFLLSKILWAFCNDFNQYKWSAVRSQTRHFHTTSFSQ